MYTGYSGHIYNHQNIECVVNGNFNNILFPKHYNKETIEKCEDGVTHCMSIESIKPGVIPINNTTYNKNSKILLNISFCFYIFIEISPFRQCGPKKTWPNPDVQNGCSSNALGSTRTCYCDTDLCNFAEKFVPNWFLMGFGLIIEVYYLLI